MGVDLQAFLNPITQVVYQLWRMEQEKQNQLDYYKQLYPLREQYSLDLARKQAEIEQQLWEERLKQQMALQQEKEKALMQPIISQATKPMDIGIAPGGLPVPTSGPFQDYLGLPAESWASLSNAPYPLSSYKLLETEQLNQQRLALALQKLIEQSQLNRARTYYYLQRGKAAGQKKSTEDPYKVIDAVLRTAESARRKLSPDRWEKVKVKTDLGEETFPEAYQNWQRAITEGNMQSAESYRKALLPAFFQTVDQTSVLAQRAMTKLAPKYAKAVFGGTTNFKGFLKKFSELPSQARVLLLLSPWLGDFQIRISGKNYTMADFLGSLGIKDIDAWREFGQTAWGWLYSSVSPYLSVLSGNVQR